MRVVQSLRQTLSKPRLSTIFILLIWASSSLAGQLPSTVSGLDLVSGLPKSVNLVQKQVTTVVFFLSVRCPCSNSHHEAITQLFKEYSGPQFQFVGIHSNANESKSLATEHFKGSNLPFPIIQDDGAQIADIFGAYKTPHVYVVNSNLDILFQGGIDNSQIAGNATKHYVRDALDALKNGKEVPEKLVRTLGCEIKRP